MAKTLSTILPLTLLLSLGFGQLLRFALFGYPVYFHDVIVVLLLLTSPRPLFAASRTLPVSLKLFLGGLAVGWLHALTLYSPQELLTPLCYTLRLLAYLAVFLVLRRRVAVLPAASFHLAGLVAAALGLLQYFFLPDMRYAQYLGWDDHLNRLTLPHYDPTFSGVMLGLALLTPAPPLAPSSGRLLLHFSRALSLLGILLTYARSVWLTLLLTLVFFVKNKITLLLTLCCLLLAIIALPEKFGEGTNLWRTYSLSSRFHADLSYLKQYSTSALLGRGLNTLILDLPESRYPNHATGPNNSYLYLLLTTGILGAVGWGSFLYSLYKNSPHKPRLMFFLVASLFNNVMFYPFALLYILLAESQQT